MTDVVPTGGRDLRPLFDPRSVAIVGASADPSKWGGDMAVRLLRGAGRRPVYLVNRRGGEMHGQTAYPALGDLPEVPELVVLATPARTFEAVVDEALGLGVKGFIGLLAGLGETGPIGRRRERAVVERLRAAGALLLGPNCMGLADFASGFEAVAYLDVPGGDIGFISQSGAMGEEFVMRAREWGCGFSRYATLGNQADVTCVEVLESLAGHDGTAVVALYLEEIGDGRRLAAAAAAVAAGRAPVVLLTPGRSAAGARAALSHTGSLAPDSAVVDAVCRAGGIALAETPRELFELSVALRGGARRRGRRVAVVSDAGGPAGVAADVLYAAGLTVPEFGPGLAERLREAVPGSAGTNPLDLAIATIDPGGFARAVPLVLQDPGVDAVLVVGQLGYWSARFPEFADIAAREVEGAARMAEAAAAARVPLVVATVYPQAAPAAELRRRGVPAYREIASAAAAVWALGEAAAVAPGVPPLPAPEEQVAPAPDYWEAREALAAAGVAFVAGRRATRVDEAVAAAGELGFPVVVKALGVLHKSDAGAVALGLADGAAVEAAVTDMERRLGPPGFVIERMAPVAGGCELIVGARRTPESGPVALVGAGGVYAELLRDTRTALAPLSEDVAEGLLGALRVAPLLRGARGAPPLDVAAAAAAAAAVSRFAAAHPEVLEVEINPLLVLREGAVALDARIITAAGDGPRGASTPVEDA